MDILINLDIKDISRNFSVDEALELLFHTINNERMGKDGCRARAKRGYICTRCEGHSGAHMAGTGEGVAHVWIAEEE
jgi:hypothetical protein